MSEVRQPQDISQGETVTFDVDIRQSNGRPFDITGFDKFKICFAGLEITETVNANGSIVTIGGVDGRDGILTVLAKAAETKDLTPDERIPLDWEIDVAATPDPIRKRIPDAINIIENDCSTP